MTFRSSNISHKLGQKKLILRVVKFQKLCKFWPTLNRVVIFLHFAISPPLMSANYRRSPPLSLSKKKSIGITKSPLRLAP